MKKGYLLLFVILLLPFNVYALTGSLSINCGSSTVKKGDTVTCSVSGTTDTLIYGVSTVIGISGNASLTKFDAAGDAWELSGIKNDGVTIYGITEQTGVNGNFDFGTLNLAIASDAQPGDVTISFSNNIFVVRNEDKDVNVTEGITSSGITINIVADTNNNNDNNNASSSSSNNEEKKPENRAAFFSTMLKEDSKFYLTELNVEGYDLEFTKDKINYLLKIDDEESLNITPVLNDESLGSYSIDGNSNLTDGSLISIVLTPNDGSEEVKYTITISKEVNNTSDVVMLNDNNKKISTIIFGIIIGALIIINVARIILNKKKNKI